MTVSSKADSLEAVARRLLRCQSTYRYYTGTGWTHDPDRAKIFLDECDAVRACVQDGLRGIDLVLQVPGSRADLFSTPVR